MLASSSGLWTLGKLFRSGGARVEAENGTAIPSVDPANFGLNVPDPDSETKNRVDELVA